MTATSDDAAIQALIDELNDLMPSYARASIDLEGTDLLTVEVTDIGATWIHTFGQTEPERLATGPIGLVSFKIRAHTYADALRGAINVVKAAQGDL